MVEREASWRLHEGLDMMQVHVPETCPVCVAFAAGRAAERAAIVADIRESSIPLPIELYSNGRQRELVEMFALRLADRIESGAGFRDQPCPVI